MKTQIDGNRRVRLSIRIIEVFILTFVLGIELYQVMFPVKPFWLD